MMRLCGPADSFTGVWPGEEGAGTHCGMVFDDVERSTICPHPTVWPEFPSWFELMMWVVDMAVIAAPFHEEIDAMIRPSSEWPHTIRLSGSPS